MTKPKHCRRQLRPKPETYKSRLRPRTRQGHTAGKAITRRRRRQTKKSPAPKKVSPVHAPIQEPKTIEQQLVELAARGLDVNPEDDLHTLLEVNLPFASDCVRAVMDAVSVQARLTRTLTHSDICDILLDTYDVPGATARHPQALVWAVLDHENVPEEDKAILYNLTFWMGDPDEDFLQDPAVPFARRREYYAALYGTRAFCDN